MSRQHTPAPWKWRENFRGLNGAGGLEVLHYESYENMWLPDYEGPWAIANARLIEAAPELYDALESVIEDLAYEIEGLIEDGVNQGWPWFKAKVRRLETARALIARIDGDT